MKKVFIKSYGCQMNVYDSGRMADVLAGEGYEETARADDADLVVLNTCHIREKAAEKVYSELGRLRVLKAERRAAGLDSALVVAGCVAQAEGREILRRAPAVDVVVGPQSYGDLPALLAASRASGAAVGTEFPAGSKFDGLPRPDPRRIRTGGVSAFLTVQEGCDKFCSFCVVPYTRGAETSRPVAAILAEAAALAESGVREITLIGQNVNAFHGEGLDGRPWTLARTVRTLAEHPGIVRIRYTTSHPLDMGADLVAAHRDVPALMPYLHLPVQSGSDRVLAAMNRRHRADDYRRAVDAVRHARPDIALSSDFIVGFPGETEAEFDETLRLAREIGFAGSFSFKYSPRAGTPAAEIADQVPEAVKDERLARLQAQLETDRQLFNRATIGRVLDILVEKPGRHPGQIGGKTPYLQAVHATGLAAEPGTVRSVRITGAAPNSLSAVAAEPARSADAPMVAAA